MRTAVIIAAAGALLFSGMAEAAEIKVLSTQATQEAYLELVAQFEKATGHKVTTVFTGTLNVQKRLADGEPYENRGCEVFEIRWDSSSSRNILLFEETVEWVGSLARAKEAIDAARASPGR